MMARKFAESAEKIGGDLPGTARVLLGLDPSWGV